ncbi:MAG: flavin reductase [Lachnospiraceae bacterium]|nr:flavin reductase [Lachnospiraceae bacterium]
MRKNFGVKPWTYPQPVFIIGTYDENGKADAMNAAWGGMSEGDELCMCLSPGHKTVKNMLKKKEFTVSMGTVDTVAICDYVGMVSGNSTPDKMEKAGLHDEKAEFVDAPYFKELPMTLECRLTKFDPMTCHCFGQIVNISVDDSVITNGTIDPDKLKPLVLDPVNSKYCALGEAVGEVLKSGAALR